MSAIQSEHPTLAAGRLLETIGPRRFVRLCDALAGASPEEAGAVLRIISDAIDTQDRVLEQLREIRSFVRGIATAGIPASKNGITCTEQPVSAE